MRRVRGFRFLNLSLHWTRHVKKVLKKGLIRKQKKSPRTHVWWPYKSRHRDCNSSTLPTCTPSHLQFPNGCLYMYKVKKSSEERCSWQVYGSDIMYKEQKHKARAGNTYMAIRNRKWSFMLEQAFSEDMETSHRNENTCFSSQNKTSFTHAMDCISPSIFPSSPAIDRNYCPDSAFHKPWENPTEAIQRKQSEMSSTTLTCVVPHPVGHSPTWGLNQTKIHIQENSFPGIFDMISHSSVSIENVTDGLCSNSN